MAFGRLGIPLFGAGRRAPSSPAPFSEPTALVLARKIRRRGDDWFAAKSYLGGLPKLGATPWPRDGDGRPLYFLAQLDLAEIFSASGDRSALPKSGALAFFLGGSKLGRIVHLAAPGEAFTSAPKGRARAEEIGGSALIDPALKYGPHEFPFWPVEFHALSPSVSYTPGDCETYEDALNAQDEAIAALFEGRQCDFSLNAACAKVGMSEPPLFWLSALMFADRVPQMLGQVASARRLAQGYMENSSARLAALEAGLPPPKGQGPWRDPAKDRADAESWLAIGRKKLDHANAHEAAVADYVARVKAAMPNMNPYLPITADAAARLDALFDEARRPPLEDYARYQLPRSWRDYAGDAFKLMASGPDEAFARLPDDLIQTFFQSCRLPINRAHIMFGVGDNVQDNPKFEEADQRLVLQLTYDDLPYWSFGDNGVCQFWMPVAALQAGDFSKADVTFECH